MPRGTVIDGKRLESLLAYGMSVKEAAQEMGINYYSVYRYMRNAKKQKQNEETLPFTDLGMMEDIKRLENSGKLNGRKIDGTPMQHDDLATYAAEIEQHYDAMTEQPMEEPEEKPAPEPPKEKSAAPRLTEEDTVRTLTGKLWVYVISSRDKTVVCRPRVHTDEFPCRAEITLGLSDAAELARDLLEIVGGDAR